MGNDIYRAVDRQVEPTVVKGIVMISIIAKIL